MATACSFLACLSVLKDIANVFKHAKLYTVESETSPKGTKHTEGDGMGRNPTQSAANRRKEHGSTLTLPSANMIVDPSRESLLEIAEAARMFHRQPKTVRRWAEPLDYLKRPKAKVLEVVKIGGRLFTSLEALNRYAAPGATTDSQRATQAAHEIAVKILRDKYGIGA